MLPLFQQVWRLNFSHWIVSLTKPFKENVRTLRSEWMAGDIDHEVTQGGRLKKPSITSWCQWVSKAWNQVDEGIVIKSNAAFQRHFMGQKTIHYFKIKVTKRVTLIATTMIFSSNCNSQGFSDFFTNLVTHYTCNDIKKITYGFYLSSLLQVSLM